jgi:hypothetical protein
MDQWIDSVNRVRSGAQLPEIEYSRAVRTFFPQIGEDDKVVKQKAAARKKEEQFIREAAGRALANKSTPAQPTQTEQPKPGGAGWRIVP